MKLCHKNKLSSFYFFRREAIINEVEVAHRCSTLCDAMDSPWNSPGQNTGVGRPRGLRHVQGQRQKLGGPHARRAGAKTSYPTSEVRAGSQECQAVTAQEPWRRATQVRGQGRRLGGATPRPHTGGQGQRRGGTTPRLRPGAAAGRTNPTSKEPWLRRRRRA